VASDGHGDEPWEGPVAGAPSDDEATRVFSRSEYAPTAPAAAAAGDEATRAFPRDPGADAFGEPGPDRAPESGGESTRSFTREAAGETTRAFSREEYLPRPEEPSAEQRGGAEGEQTSFTRRFVRDRPGGRAPRPESGFDPAAGANPAFDPDFEPEPEPEREYAPERPARRRPVRTRRRRRRFRLRWIVALVLLTALALPPGTWAWVWYTARQDDRTPSDAIVVLGASQYNGVPSPVFEARLRQAQELYLEGVAPVIVTVGGKQPEDNFTEAASGRNWLVEVGVPADQVVAVEEGSDTLQSIAAVSQVFDANGWETAILVSDPWHSARSQKMAGDFGIEAGTSPARSGPAVIERRTQLWYITRETASLWYYIIFNDSSDIRVNAA
jgi:uncharacterized SAM-binding protein YcdF (DUF218 family)